MSFFSTFRWPRISVVTPSFNQAPFLEQCLRSVLDQGCDNLEYIVIDGGSTDGSVDLIRKYESRLAHWVSERDAGQSDAINKGFRRSTGEVVTWLNSDDYLLRGALKAVAKAYQQQPAASFYLGNGLRVDRTGKTLAPFFPNNVVTFHRPALVWGLNCVLQPSAFINRACLEKAGLLDVNLKYGMDSDLWLRLSAVAEPVCVQALLAASREYGDTKTSTGSFARVEELRQIAEAHSQCPMTPGALLYFLDTLHRLAKSRPDVYPAAFVQAVEKFWGSCGPLLAGFGARPDGFALEPKQRRAG